MLEHGEASIRKVLDKLSPVWPVKLTYLLYELAIDAKNQDSDIPFDMLWDDNAIGTL